jgi:hypothetical protein
VLFKNIIINSVQSIKNLKTAVGLGFEERTEIKQLGPPRPNLKICEQNLIKGKILVRNFNRGMYEYNNASWLCVCDVSNSFYCFVCLVMGSADCDLAWVQTGVTDLKHLGQKVKKHAISQKHLFYSVEFGILGNTDLRNQLSGVYRLEIQKHNEKVKQNRYILRKLIDAIKFCGAFELALRGHDEGVESNNPGIFRGLINLIAEVDDILKLHIDQSKNAVFTDTDMDINSNKKVLGTIRIDPSVPSLSILSRAATGAKENKE